MDFWASLEHQLKYKQEIPNQQEIITQLRQCAASSTKRDEKMLDIRQQIEEMADTPSEEDILFEKAQPAGFVGGALSPSNSGRPPGGQKGGGMPSNILNLTTSPNATAAAAPQVNALSGVTFGIDQGEFCILLGSSGAGKTTLLNLLGGMDTVTSGRIDF